MNNYRKWLDPGGFKLARRLEQLRDSFNDLAARLRSTVASAVGETLGNVIQDVMLHTLNRLSATDSPVERPGLPLHQDHWSGSYDRGEQVDQGRVWGQPDRSHNDHRDD